MSERIGSDTWRAKAGAVGAIGAATALAIVTIAYGLLEASFRTWTVGRFFANRAGIFVDLFLIMAACSVVTLILPCLGYGKRRSFGVAFSIATFALVVFTFGTNK